MPPWQGGGDMILSVTFEKTTYNAIPYKFEAGTPNIAGTIALGAALDYLTGIGMDRIAAHEHELLALRARRAARGAGAAPHRHRPREGRRRLVRAGGRPPARHGHRARLRGRRHPHRPPLRAAGDGALRRARHRARVARALQHAGRGGRAGRGAPQGPGDVRDELRAARAVSGGHPGPQPSSPRNFREMPEAAATRRATTRSAATARPCSSKLGTATREGRGLRGQRLLDLDRVGVDDDRGA